jgi:hypothetical protein
VNGVPDKICLDDSIAWLPDSYCPALSLFLLSGVAAATLAGDASLSLKIPLSSIF